jgi:hypothetical protein
MRVIHVQQQKKCNEAYFFSSSSFYSFCFYYKIVWRYETKNIEKAKLAIITISMYSTQTNIKQQEGEREKRALPYYVPSMQKYLMFISFLFLCVWYDRNIAYRYNLKTITTRTTQIILDRYCNINNNR